MKKYIMIVSLLLLSIVLPYKDIKANFTGNVVQIGAHVLENGSYVFCGLAVGEAIQKRNTQVLISPKALVGTGFIAWSFYNFLRLSSQNCENEKLALAHGLTIVITTALIKLNINK